MVGHLAEVDQLDERGEKLCEDEPAHKIRVVP
jgi:hypothetical protein